MTYPLFLRCVADVRLKDSFYFRVIITLDIEILHLVTSTFYVKLVGNRGYRTKFVLVFNTELEGEDINNFQRTITCN